MTPTHTEPKGGAPSAHEKNGATVDVDKVVGKGKRKARAKDKAPPERAQTASAAPPIVAPAEASAPVVVDEGAAVQAWFEEGEGFVEARDDVYLWRAETGRKAPLQGFAVIAPYRLVERVRGEYAAVLIVLTEPALAHRTEDSPVAEVEPGRVVAVRLSPSLADKLAEALADDSVRREVKILHVAFTGEGEAIYRVRLGKVVPAAVAVDAYHHGMHLYRVDGGEASLDERLPAAAPLPAPPSATALPPDPPPQIAPMPMGNPIAPAPIKMPLQSPTSMLAGAAGELLVMPESDPLPPEMDMRPRAVARPDAAPAAPGPMPSPPLATPSPPAAPKVRTLADFRKGNAK